MGKLSIGVTAIVSSVKQRDEKWLKTVRIQVPSDARQCPLLQLKEALASAYWSTIQKC